MNEVTKYKELVIHFGSQQKTADALHVSQAAVSYWVSGVKKMTISPALTAEKATNGKFKAVELCPALKEFQTLTV